MEAKGNELPNPDERDKYLGGIFNHTISNDIPLFEVCAYLLFFMTEV